MARMLYAILGEDVPDSLPLRRQHRPAHLAHLRRLQDEGRLLVAGPRPAIDALDPGPAGFVGSIVIAEFDNLDDARAFADADPYAREGVFRSVEVLPFIGVLPE